VNTRNPEEGTERAQVDVAAAVRRGQRGFVIRLAGMWVAVLATTAVLIMVGAVARSYLGAPSVSWRLNSATSQGAGALVFLLAAALLAVASLTLGVRRLRLRPRRPLLHAPSVQAVPEPGPLGQVSVRNTGTAVTHTVRIEPSPGASITTIEEVRP
jgi:hypothetical protein